MSTPRVVIGKRPDGNIGLFISSSGGNALNDSLGSLLLSATSRISRLVMSVALSPGSHSVALGFSRSPYIFLTCRQSVVVPVYGTLAGKINPSPWDGTAGATASMIGNGASINVSNPILITDIEVYNAAYT